VFWNDFLGFPAFAIDELSVLDIKYSEAKPQIIDCDEYPSIRVPEFTSTYRVTDLHRAIHIHETGRKPGAFTLY
jgi:hypothetical protein